MNTVPLDFDTLAALIGLGLVTLLTRGFFMLPSRAWPLPVWLRKGLRYAPLAALTAVVAPEVVMTQGQLISTWQDARWPAALVGAAFYTLTRNILGTIVVGMAVLLGLRFGLGW